MLTHARDIGVADKIDSEHEKGKSKAIIGAGLG